MADEATRASEAQYALDADNEAALDPAEFDLDAFRRQAIAVHEVLNQSAHWIDARGRVLAIVEMEVGYKANILRFIRRRVGYYAARYPWGAIFAMSLPSGWAEVQPDLTAGRSVSRGEMWLDDGGNMSHAFDRHIDELHERIRRDPVEWLDSTKLMEELSRQVAAGEGGAVGSRPENRPREVAICDPCPRAGCGDALARHPRSGRLVRLCTGEWVRPT